MELKTEAILSSVRLYVFPVRSGEGVTVSVSLLLSVGLVLVTAVGLLKMIIREEDESPSLFFFSRSASRRACLRNEFLLAFVVLMVEQ